MRTVARGVPTRSSRLPPSPPINAHTYTRRAHNTHSPARLPLPVGRPLPSGNSAVGTTQHNTTQHTTTQHNTTQHNTTQHNTTQRNAPHRTTPHRNATQRNTTQHNAPQRNAPHRTAPHRTAPHRTAPHRTTPQPNSTQHNTTQHSTTQHNTTQHNTTQRNATHRTAPHCTAPHRTAPHRTTPQPNSTQHNTTQHNTTQHNTTQHNTTQHNTTQHNTTQHNTTQHNTTQHNTTALPMGWVPGAKPPTTGPGHHPNGWCTNSVGCTRAPAPSTTPEGARGPLVPAARAPGTDQRSLERTAGTASPSISPQRLCPTHRALCPNSIPHTPMQHSVPPMHYLPRPLPATSPQCLLCATSPRSSLPPPLPCAPPAPSEAHAPLAGWQRPCGAPPRPRVGGRPRGQLTGGYAECVGGSARCESGRAPRRGLQRLAAMGRLERR